MARPFRPPGSSRPTARETLQAYIERAVDPYLHEPNLSLNLEIADIINSKKANTPREAAVEVVKFVNHRNTHVAMLALQLLDILVKNCGYPFHLQISTKEFLNDLVRRFPERPPVFPPPPMAKILELVHEWKNTICLTSKHKEDLVHIRDMHRLLTYKGYRFPETNRQGASVLNPSENLRTADELEEEDREAQAAKLQELIRRGTPKDLAAAQELMKVMAGAEPEKRPDYEKQVSKELDRIQQRIIMLNDMLDNAKPHERFVEGDAFDQVASKSRHVQPKLQKWIEEMGETNPSEIDRLLLINDLINNVLKRYEGYKTGDRSVQADIDPSLLSKDAKAIRAKAKANQVSLIDFDEEAPATTPTGASSSNPMDDLAEFGGLSLGGVGGAGPATGSQAGGETLFESVSSAPATQSGGSFWSNPAPAASSNGVYGAGQPSNGSQGAFNNGAAARTAMGYQPSPPPQQQASRPYTPNYNLGSSFSTGPAGSGTTSTALASSWGASASPSQGGSRSSTPLSAGAGGLGSIQLGGPGSRPASRAATPAAAGWGQSASSSGTPVTAGWAQQPAAAAVPVTAGWGQQQPAATPPAAAGWNMQKPQPSIPQPQQQQQGGKDPFGDLLDLKF